MVLVMVTGFRRYEQQDFYKACHIVSPFFYMAFACCVNAYVVSVHTSST